MSHISNYPKRGGQQVSPFSFPIPYIIYSTHPHRGLKPTAIDDPHGIRVGMENEKTQVMHGVKIPYEW